MARHKGVDSLDDGYASPTRSRRLRGEAGRRDQKGDFVIVRTGHQNAA